MEVKGYRVALIDGKVRVWKYIFSKIFLSSGLYQVARSPLGTMSINTSLEVYESDGDRDVWIQKEHEGTCLRCTKGKYYKGTIPLM